MKTLIYGAGILLVLLSPAFAQAAQAKKSNDADQPIIVKQTILIPGDFSILVTETDQSKVASYADQMKINPGSDVDGYVYDSSGSSIKLELLHLVGTYAVANLNAPLSFRPRKVMFSNNHLATYKIVTNVPGFTDSALVSYTPLPDREVQARFGKRISSRFYAFDVQIQNLRADTLQVSRAALAFEITYCEVQSKHTCGTQTLVKQRPPEDPTSVLAVFDNVTDRKKATFDGASDIGKGASSVIASFLTGNDLATQAATMFNSSAIPFASKFFVHEDRDKVLHDNVVGAAIKDNFLVAGSATETMTVFVTKEPISGIRGTAMMVQSVGDLHFDARWIQPAAESNQPVTGKSTQSQQTTQLILQTPSSRTGD